MLPFIFIFFFIFIFIIYLYSIHVYAFAMRPHALACTGIPVHIFIPVFLLEYAFVYNRMRTVCCCMPYASLMHPEAYITYASAPK